MSSARTQPVVLVVDDELSLRQMLGESLTLEGFTVEIATNGQEAITILESAPGTRRVMLLDLYMPVMDGWAVVRWLVEHPEIKEQTTIVLMSANERLKQASDLEHDAELPKPFGIDRVLELINQ